jgi:hypothetical protein
MAMGIGYKLLEGDRDTYCATAIAQKSDVIGYCNRHGQSSVTFGTSQEEKSI